MTTLTSAAHGTALLRAHAGADATMAERAAAHCAQTLTRRAQRFQGGVTDTESALAMLAVEVGYVFVRGAVHWRCTTRLPVPPSRLGLAIGELIRTGLVRDYRNPRTGERSLIPAPVHLAVDGASACRFVGEDLGPMRARLVADLELVDCRNCLAEVA